MVDLSKFQVPEVRREIEDSRITVPRSSNYAARAISDVGGLAGEAVLGYKKGQIQKSIEAAGDATAVAAGLAGEGIFVSEEGATVDKQGKAIDNLTAQQADDLSKVQREAGTAFSKISQSIAQGNTSRSAAGLYAESELKRISALTPGFSSELRTMAADLLGFDPTGFALQRMFQDKKAEARTLTFAEKLEEKAEAYHAETGRSRQEFKRIEMLNMHFASKVAVNKNRVAMGDITAQEQVLDSQTMLSPTEELFSKLGGSIDFGKKTFTDEEMGLVGDTITQITENWSRQYSQPVLDAEGRQIAPAMSANAVKEAEVINIKRTASMKALVNDRDRFTVMAESTEQFQVLAKYEAIRNNPEFQTFLATMPPSVVKEVLALTAAAASPEDLKMRMERNPFIKEALSGNSDKFVVSYANALTAYLGGPATSTGNRDLDEHLTNEVAKDMGKRDLPLAVENGFAVDRPYATVSLVGNDPMSYAKLDDTLRNQVVTEASSLLVDSIEEIARELATNPNLSVVLEATNRDDEISIRSSKGFRAARNLLVDPRWRKAIINENPNWRGTYIDVVKKRAEEIREEVSKGKRVDVRKSVHQQVIALEEILDVTTNPELRDSLQASLDNLQASIEKESN